MQLPCHVTLCVSLCQRLDCHDRRYCSYIRPSSVSPLLLLPCPPPSLCAPVLQLDPLLLLDQTRRRYRFLDHLPACVSLSLAEVSLQSLLPGEALAPFQEELRAREDRRRRTREKVGGSKQGREGGRGRMWGRRGAMEEYRCTVHVAGCCNDGDVAPWCGTAPVAEVHVPCMAYSEEGMSCKCAIIRLHHLPGSLPRLLCLLSIPRLLSLCCCLDLRCLR